MLQRKFPIQFSNSQTARSFAIVIASQRVAHWRDPLARNDVELQTHVRASRRDAPESLINLSPLGQHCSLDLFPALLIFKLGLIDEVLAPASTNKRPVPEWQCHTAKAKSSASTRTDMHVNERTVGRSGSLFVWVAGMGNGLIGLVHLKILSLASGCITQGYFRQLFGLNQPSPLHRSRGKAVDQMALQEAEQHGHRDCAQDDAGR